MWQLVDRALKAGYLLRSHFGSSHFGVEIASRGGPPARPSDTLSSGAQCNRMKLAAMVPSRLVMILSALELSGAIVLKAVPAQCKLTIWEHTDRGGRSDTFTGVNVNIVMADFIKKVPHDSVSSLEVSGTPNCRATLYQHRLLDKNKGWAVNFAPGYYDVEAMKKSGAKNDEASSAALWMDRR